jgi:hypothetical protein
MSRVRTVLVAVLMLLVAATLAGVVALWPSGRGPKRVDLGEESLRATVIAAGPIRCPDDPTAPGPLEDCRLKDCRLKDCRQLRVKLTSSDDRGSVVRSSSRHPPAWASMTG